MRYSATVRLAPAAAFAVLAASIAVAQSGAPQNPPAPQQPPFRTEANFVRVDAYPSENGQPVQDLRAGDFEVFEDGVPQSIQTFEHVVIRPAGPQEERMEPNSQRDMLQAAANPRNRIFVIFLDAPHVTVEGSHAVAEPLIKLIDRILGPDDLVGIMTPAMSADNVVLARKTQVTEEQLRRYWPWGERFRFTRDDREEQYIACYPPLSGEGTESALAKKLIARKRERATLEAMEDLVRYLHGIREERKAILAVTEGWLLYRQDPTLMNVRTDPVTKQPVDPIPSVDPPRPGPDGRLTTKDPRHEGYVSLMECNTDRMRLATMDDEKYFRDILDEANRANASFYPIDPRGLPVFDTPIGPDPPLPGAADAASLKNRQEAMRVLAVNTDGIAVMNNNDLDKGLRRIADDLTSYYLLGYYSTNAKLDGGFRSLKVRVKRPGVSVRARRGYRAATAAEVNAARTAAAPPAPEASSSVTAAMGALARIRPDARLRIYASAAPAAGTIWVAGELPVVSGRSDEWPLGANADIEVRSGEASSTARVSLKPGERWFLTSLKLPGGAAAGELDVRARLTAVDGTAAPATDAIGLKVRPASIQPVLFRRGPMTGNRPRPAADPSFSRSERVRLEFPVSADVKPGAARVLDRAAQPLQLPVAMGERTDETGQRWLTAEVTLAPLAPADYAIEVGLIRAAGEERVVTAIRVTR